ncbi:MAG: hypothetical protein RLZZ283_437 [Candidatus Parcubacteria bacterium]|jgi:hypothetical protein
MGAIEAQQKESAFKERMPAQLREKLTSLRPLLERDVVVHVHVGSQPVHGKLIAALPTYQNRQPAIELVLIEQRGIKCGKKKYCISDTRQIEDATQYAVTQANRKHKPWPARLLESFHVK